MKKNWVWAVLAGLALAALFSLRSSISLGVLTEPLRSLWGAPEQLSAGTLEVSQNLDTVETATRRLLKPLGAVHVTRIFTNPVTYDDSKNSSEKR